LRFLIRDNRPLRSVADRAHPYIGNTRTTILNWLFARKWGGRFVLRYDDTDVGRSTVEFAKGIAADLELLGIRPDRVELGDAQNLVERGER